MTYFEENWISKVNLRRQRSEPRFSLAWWNVFEATKANLPRTNIDVEAWHRGFEALVGVHHANLWRSIDNFRKEQALNDVTTAQCTAGGPPSAKKRRCADISTRLQNLAQGYNEETTDTMQYLRGIAHNLKL